MLAKLSIAAGVGAGLVVALLIVGTTPAPGRPVAGGRMISDFAGGLDELVIQYASPAEAIVVPICRQFLAKLPVSVTVHVVCPDAAAWDGFREAVGSVPCRLNPVIVGHAMTSWSRDRWVALALAEGDGPMTLLRGREEMAADVWPARAGDERIAADLARSVSGVRAERSGLLFDGGDFVCDGRVALVAARVVERNLHDTVRTRGELLDRLQRDLGLPVVVLADAPDHHAGMYVMPAGSDTVLVADPSLGRSLVEDEALGRLLPMGADFSPQLQRQLDGVARQLRDLGRTVVRMPVVPGADGRTWLTPLNAILADEGLGAARVYMPVYRGAERLNARAAKVWESVGYEVVCVDCTSSYRHFGSLRCLVNVLRRGR